MSKSTTPSTDSSAKKARKAIPAPILAYVRDTAMYGAKIYRIPLYLPILAYIRATKGGKLSVKQRNPLNLDAVGTERIGKNGKADYISEKEGFARGCRRWRVEFREVLDTLSGKELVKAIDPALLETDYDITNILTEA